MAHEDDNKGSSFPERVWETAAAFRRSKAFLSAVELDLFTALGSEPATSAEVARSIGCDARATDRLMNAIAALGFLRKDGERFANTPEGLRFLVRGSPDYLEGLMHSANLWRKWSTLTEAVRAGGSVEPTGVTNRSPEWIRTFISAMNDRSKSHAAAFAAWLDLSGVHTVLDLGGGSGAYAAALVNTGEGITATVFDLPDVVPLTRRFLDEAGCARSVRTVAGDFLADELESGYDLVLMSAILHSLAPEQNRTLIARTASALNRGGRLVVRDFVMSPDRTTPLRGALFALNMLVNTDGGDTYTEEEFRGWMEAAGLTGVQRYVTPDGDDVVIGTKPA